MARGRMVKTDCKCGGTFQITGEVDDIKVTLKCNSCDKEKSARRDKVPDGVEDISGDVAAAVIAATNEEEIAVEVDQTEVVIDEADENLTEVAVD